VINKFFFFFFFPFSVWSSVIQQTQQYKSKPIFKKKHTTNFTDNKMEFLIVVLKKKMKKIGV